MDYVGTPILYNDSRMGEIYTIKLGIGADTLESVPSKVEGMLNDKYRISEVLFNEDQTELEIKCKGTEKILEDDLDEGKAYNIMIGGKPLDLNKEYRISTGSFVADGNCGGDHFFANPESMLDTGIIMRDAQIAYIEYLKEVPEIDIQTIKLVGKPQKKNFVK